MAHDAFTEDGGEGVRAGSPAAKLNARQARDEQRAAEAKDKAKTFKDTVTDPIKKAREIRQRSVTDYVYQLAGLPVPRNVALGEEDDARILPPGLRRYIETDAEREARFGGLSPTHDATGGQQPPGGGSSGGRSRGPIGRNPEDENEGRDRDNDRKSGDRDGDLGRDQDNDFGVLDPFPAPTNRFAAPNPSSRDRFDTTQNFYDPFGNSNPSRNTRRF